MAITWYDSLDAQISAAITLTAEQGSTSAATQLDVYNNRNGVGASTLVDLLLEVAEIVDDLPVTSGTEALDQHHVEVQLVEGIGQTVTPSGWTRIGTARWLALPPIPNDTGLRLEVRLSPASYATSTQVRVNFHLVSRSSRPIPLGISEAAGDGVYHGLGDAGYSALVSFATMAQNPGGADDEVSIPAIRWVYQGQPYALLAQLLAFTDQDGSAGTLGSGESYIAVLTVAAGTLTVTKGDKGTTPTRPTAPAGELLLGAVEVPFGLVISNAEISNEWLLGCFGVQSQSALTLTIGAGDAVAGNQLIHRDGSQQITLADDDVSEVWLTPAGTPAATIDGSKPAARAISLYEVTAAGGVLTAIVDRRLWSPPPRVIELTIDTGSAMITNDEGQSANPLPRPFGLLPADPLSMWVHDFGTTPASGETRADIEHDVAYDGTWASIFAADADMPAVAFGATVALAPAASPDDLILPAGGRLRARADEVAGAATAPGGLTVLLRGWPL